MSFVEWKDVMNYGDIVILFVRHDKVDSIVLEEGGVYNTPFGSISHSDIVGRPFGSRLYYAEIQRKKMGMEWDRPRQGFILALHPTNSLWSKAVAHRTQIIFNSDISYICFILGITPGDIVCEAGTGSGVLTTSLARYVAPNGKVYTHEFHIGRKETAEAEFSRNGISHLISVSHRDVITEGFDVPDGIKVDAVALDLPSPWAVVPKIKSVLKSESKAVSFSPCIEQAQKMTMELMKNGFINVETVEIRFRRYEVQHSEVIPVDRLIEDMKGPQKRKRRKNMSAKLPAPSLDTDSDVSSQSFSRYYSDHHGHTGYLTFADWYSD